MPRLAKIRTDWEYAYEQAKLYPTSFVHCITFLIIDERVLTAAYREHAKRSR